MYEIGSVASKCFKSRTLKHPLLNTDSQLSYEQLLNRYFSVIMKATLDHPQFTAITTGRVRAVADAFAMMRLTGKTETIKLMDGTGLLATEKNIWEILRNCPNWLTFKLVSWEIKQRTKRRLH